MTHHVGQAREALLASEHERVDVRSTRPKLTLWRRKSRTLRSPRLPFSPPPLTSGLADAVIEAMEDDPFVDDAYLASTTQQCQRIRDLRLRRMHRLRLSAPRVFCQGPVHPSEIVGLLDIGKAEGLPGTVKEIA